MTASSVPAPCMSSANAFSPARRPVVLEIATGFTAQRLPDPSRRSGRVGRCGPPSRPAPLTSAPGAPMERVGRIFQMQWAGGDMPAGTRITIDQETALLERLLDADPPPSAHRAALAGIRLAEIYRTHQQDPAQADALIARLSARYPDAPALAPTRRGPTGSAPGALPTIQQATAALA